MPPFFLLAALYLLALYAGWTAFLPLLGVLVTGAALGYWASAARCIITERRYRRRARALRQLRGGVR